MDDANGADAGADFLTKVHALARKHPRLHHMTEAGNGEAIRSRGLWSTSALLDRNTVPVEARAGIEAQRRAASETLPDGAVIRDNKVLLEGLLAPLLPAGMAPRDWYLLLNTHVFFWPSNKRSEPGKGLKGLLRAYRAAEHDVLEFDTASLLGAHSGRVRVTPMNTGATGRSQPERGPEAFLPLARWPASPSTPFWTTPSGAPRPVREVAVLGGVPDAGDHLVSITRRRHGAEPRTLWSR